MPLCSDRLITSMTHLLIMGKIGKTSLGGQVGMVLKRQVDVLNEETRFVS